MRDFLAAAGTNRRMPAFAHAAGVVYDLQVAGEAEPLGVTALHPVWSLDRNDWVPASELEAGETVKTLTGTSTVESLTPREDVEPVYNIEVEGDHVYRVGRCGVLVHNASPGRMSFQVQWGTNAGGPTFQETVSGTDDCPEVTVEQANDALDRLLEKVVPRRAQTAAAPAVQATQNWVETRPPYGIGPQTGDIHREHFQYRRYTDARVDTINRHGKNLTR